MHGRWRPVAKRNSLTLFIIISLFSYTNLSLQPEAYPSVTVYLHDCIVCILVFIMNISEKLDSWIMLNNNQPINQSINQLFFQQFNPALAKFEIKLSLWEYNFCMEAHVSVDKFIITYLKNDFTLTKYSYTLY
jgi:hypothetical protein